MNTQFYGYRSAESEALRLSICNPGTTYFVNWVEDNVWVVETTQELPEQPCWINGQMHYAGELLPACDGLIVMTSQR